MNSLDDVLVHELQDLLSAERQLVKALPKMSKNANDPRLASAMDTHLQETEVHVERIQESLKKLDRSPGRMKCKGMEGLIEEGEELLEMTGEAAAIDLAMIGAARRVEHYEMAAYMSAIAQAEAAGHREIAKLLKATLEEERKTDELLTALSREELTELVSASVEEDGSDGR